MAKDSKFDPRSFSVSSIARGGKQNDDMIEPIVDPHTAGAKPKAPFALGLMLENAGLVSHDMIQELVKTGQESAQSLKRSLIQQGVVSEDDILDATAEDFGMERVNLREITPTPELLSVLTPAIAKKYRVFPVRADDEEIVLALSDPFNVAAMDDLMMRLGKRIVGVIASEQDVERYIEKYYEGDEIGKIYEEFTQVSANPFAKSLEEYETISLDSDNRDVHPAVRFVDLIFREAVHQRASDIHIEPCRAGVRIRFRIDSVCQELPMPPKRWQNMIISRLKVLSGMDLAEKRIPQDGRIKLTLPDKNLDLRVSCLPSIYGETIVMRILDASEVLRGLEEVGFLPDTVTMFKRLIKAPNGVILMTGPTGSGKTTTLNSALSTLNNPETKIITVEDPVEYQIQGINQIQVNTEVNLTFATALRSMLRMSPDVIMVGEIRDLETAEIAIRAALTGHLVFSTLHTNDAPSATIRLIDMGVKPFLVASSIQAVIAQRLIRRICANCKHPITPTPEDLVEMEQDPSTFKQNIFMGGGCERCNDGGYRGRTAIHEIFTMNAELRKMVIRSESTVKLKKVGMANGMRTLRQDGWQKILLGQTTIDEVKKVTQRDF